MSHVWQRERWEQMQRLAPDVFNDTEKAIRGNVDWLIQHLYDPNDESGTRASDRVDRYGIGDEPINWGDLKCVEVEPVADGFWIVTVDEAAPGDCYGLCEYIRSWMEKWGWAVRVETEW